MLEVWRRMVIGSAIAVYIAGLGCAAGMLLARMRADERPGRGQGASVEIATQTAGFRADIAWARVAAAEMGR